MRFFMMDHCAADGGNGKALMREGSGRQPAEVDDGRPAAEGGVEQRSAGSARQAEQRPTTPSDGRRV